MCLDLHRLEGVEQKMGRYCPLLREAGTTLSRTENECLLGEKKEKKFGVIMFLHMH